MNKIQLLTVTSVITMALLTLHIVDDIARGFDSAGMMNMVGIVVAAILLYGTTALRERLAGQIMMFLLSFAAAAMPVIHLRSPRINEIAHAPGGFFFVWTLWALGIIGIFGMILAVHTVWERRGRGPQGG